MIGRIIAALAFLAGGIFTWIVLTGLQGFGAAQAGMGDGSGAGRSSGDGLLPYLASLYFIVSAVGVILCRKREDLRATAAVAHTFLVITLLVICSEALGNANANVFTGLLFLLVLSAIFFSPWLLLWAYFLFRRQDGK
ncbi:MAG TPA: hypothetical protein VMB21_01995 [Candidatus Limnocylindria bacterium]|jgi:hypothetical protein|nr:hypothetical protein [Candidatus Limnocylindria bacterium]